MNMCQNNIPSEFLASKVGCRYFWRNLEAFNQEDIFFKGLWNFVVLFLQANTENVRVSADDTASSQAGYHPTQGLFSQFCTPFFLILLFCLLSVCDSLWRFFSSHLFVSRYRYQHFIYFHFLFFMSFCFIAFALVFSNVYFYSTSFFSFSEPSLFVFFLSFYCNSFL